MKVITVYEHTALTLTGGGVGEHKRLTPDELQALQTFHGSGRKFPFYRLIHQGVRFRGYVGTIRVGETTIEILPKADRLGDDEYWRGRLFDMLRVAHDLPLHTPSAAHLRTRPHDVLHLYLRLLLKQCERLYRRGLHRAYHVEEANATALSGRLLFGEHLRRNLVHRERFYVSRDRFDFATPLNRLLRQGLTEAVRLNGSRTLRPRFHRLLETWPELPPQPVTEATFERLRFPRGTEEYRPAVAIARLILLRHAGEHRGGRDLPALLFNVNQLWEAFLERTLRRELRDYAVSGQCRTAYWSAPGLPDSMLRPDLTLSDPVTGAPRFLLDAKWKVPHRHRPAAGDLQQLYTYGHVHGARGVGLLYPQTDRRDPVRGAFQRLGELPSGMPCHVGFVPLPEADWGLSDWQREIGVAVRGMLGGGDPAELGA